MGNVREVWKSGTPAQTVQRMQYYPSGLPWADCMGADYQNRKYNGKEFIEMHGYDSYDYHARHMFPALMRFTTPDPLAEKYYSISNYAYCANNPIKYIDPNGMWIESAWDAISLGMGVKSFVDNVKQGNVKGAIIDGVGIVADGAALILPGVPGGAGAGIKAARAGNKVVDAVQAGKAADKLDKVGDAGKTYQTYTKAPKNPADGVYSGRTSGKGTPRENVAKRDKKHHKNKTHGPAVLDKSSSNPDAIRGREQQNIESYGGAKSQGGTSGNKINGVSPNNKNAQRYKNAAQKEFGI